MQTEIAGSVLWDREYETLKVIPSSIRTTPSKALLLFSEILGLEEGGTALDAGCGTGRNSIYLARKGYDVYAIDFSNVALAKLHDLVTQAGLRHKIRSYDRSLAEPLPFPDNFFSLALDSYVSCHFIDKDPKRHYWRELLRVVRPGGRVFSSVFSVEDSYYGPMIDDAGRETKIILDPNNGIRKELYTEREIKEFFGKDFKLEYFTKFEFEDFVLGQSYWRSILISILSKR